MNIPTPTCHISLNGVTVDTQKHHFRYTIKHILEAQSCGTDNLQCAYWVITSKFPNIKLCHLKVCTGQCTHLKVCIGQCSRVGLDTLLMINLLLLNKLWTMLNRHTKGGEAHLRPHCQELAETLECIVTCNGTSMMQHDHCNADVPFSG